MNHYLLLGVPDVGEGSSADRFRQILNAYETLNDPTRRGHYDRSLQIRCVPGAQFVEPLRARAAPEPMLSHRRGVVPGSSSYEPLRQTPVAELIDEWFQLWDEMFFGDLRRCDRI